MSCRSPSVNLIDFPLFYSMLLSTAHTATLLWRYPNALLGICLGCHTLGSRYQVLRPWRSPRVIVLPWPRLRAMYIPRYRMAANTHQGAWTHPLLESCDTKVKTMAWTSNGWPCGISEALRREGGSPQNGRCLFPLSDWHGLDVLQCTQWGRCSEVFLYPIPNLFWSIVSPTIVEFNLLVTSRDNRLPIDSSSSQVLIYHA